MPDLKHRSTEVELMDDLNCSGPMVDQTLIEIEFINKWLGGNAVTLHGFNSLLKHLSKTTTLTVADLGCGGGEMLKLLAQQLRTQKLKVTLTGIDANPGIVAFAEHHAQAFPEIQFKTLNVLSEPFTHETFDIVTATLFFHHFTKEELIYLFKLLKNNVRLGMVINDLHRHPLAYYAIKWLTKIFSRSVMVRYDAPLSVHRGFKRAELVEILSAAGIENYTLRWKWAFRWQLIITV